MIQVQQSRRAFVTGATGFIGTRLVQQLISHGYRVSALARRTSNTEMLKRCGCGIVYGDIVKDLTSVSSEVDRCDTVFHLAAATHAVRSSDLLNSNPTGVRNILEACAAVDEPPKVIIVSSLAAAGPSHGADPLVETDSQNPVSFYGRSKAASEAEAFKFADRLPVSIVRPPIVLGDGDRKGLLMFQPIDSLGCHFVPGFRKRWFSLIHVDDLVAALIEIARSGKRLDVESPSQGVYFVSADEVLTYSELGKLIGRALGRKRTQNIKVASPIMYAISWFNELKGRLVSKPQFLNRDKLREALGGSWVCSNEKLKRETGFELPCSLLQRLEQTANWYRDHGWLKDRGSIIQPEAIGSYSQNRLRDDAMPESVSTNRELERR